MDSKSERPVIHLAPLSDLRIMRAFSSCCRRHIAQDEESIFMFFSLTFYYVLAETLLASSLASQNFVSVCTRYPFCSPPSLAYLFEMHGEKEKSSMYWFTLKMPATAGVRPGWSHEPGIVLVCLSCIAGIQGLEPLSPTNQGVCEQEMGTEQGLKHRHSIVGCRVPKWGVKPLPNAHSTFCVLTQATETHVERLGDFFTALGYCQTHSGSSKDLPCESVYGCLIPSMVG